MRATREHVVGTHFQQMRQALSNWAELSDEQWAALVTPFQPRSVARGTHILLPGATVHELIFVNQGLLRFYYLSEDGKESNKAFIGEDTFAGALAAFSLGLPVLYGIEALEDTVILVASLADFVALYDVDPVFDRLGRQLAEWQLMRKELRARSLLQQSAMERYQDFLSQYPELAGRVPQYHIASYLGITEVSLSRLRRSLR